VAVVAVQQVLVLMVVAVVVLDGAIRQVVEAVAGVQVKLQWLTHLLLVEHKEKHTYAVQVVVVPKAAQVVLVDKLQMQTV
jgi:hypothetical protein